MIKSQKGFAAPALILIVIVMMVIGIVGYRIVKSSSSTGEVRNSDKIKSSNSSEDSRLADAADTNTFEALDTNASNSENSGTSGQEDTTPEYDAIATKDDLTFEIRPKSIKIGKIVEYRLSGGLLALGNAVDIGIIDSSGNYRNIAGLIMYADGVREGTVTIPDNVYDCKFGASCSYTLVATAKGTGKLIVTHAPTNVIDISIPIEIL